MKNKGIWIVIVLILVCGVAVTSYTSRMVGQSGMSAGQTSRSMASSGAAAYGAALAGGGLPSEIAGQLPAYGGEETEADAPADTADEGAAVSETAGSGDGNKIREEDEDAPAAAGGAALPSSAAEGGEAAMAAPDLADIAAAEDTSDSRGAAEAETGAGSGSARSGARPKHGTRGKNGGSEKSRKSENSKEGRGREDRSAVTEQTEETSRTLSVADTPAKDESAAGDSQGAADAGVSAAAFSLKEEEGQDVSGETAAVPETVAISPLSGRRENAAAKEDAAAMTRSELEERLKKVDDKIKKARDEDMDMSTNAVRAVFSSELRMWESEMKLIIENLQLVMDEEETEALSGEQKQWSADREKKAQGAAASYKGGTMESVEYTAIMANLTRDRAYELLKDYGDLLE